MLALERSFTAVPILDLGPMPPSANQPHPSDMASPISRTAVSLEYASLRHSGHCPLGIYVVPSIDNLLVWDGVFFVHQGYYTDGIFKFKLTFPSDYPERPPVVQFISDVFHPLIAPKTGIFNLAPRFRPWRPKEHHVFDVLHWVKAAFKRHALDKMKEFDSVNKEAFRLYHDSTSSFATLATQSSALSQTSSSLFDRNHVPRGSDAMHFRELKQDQLTSLRSKLGLTEWSDII